MKLPLLGPVSLTGFQNAWFFLFLLIVLLSPSGLIGLWERAVSFLSGPRRGPSDRTPVEVQTAEPSI